MTKDVTNNKWQNYDARQKAKGYKKVTVWTPDEVALKKYAGKQRKAHDRKSK